MKLGREQKQIIVESVIQILLMIVSLIVLVNGAELRKLMNVVYVVVVGLQIVHVIVMEISWMNAVYVAVQACPMEIVIVMVI